MKYKKYDLENNVFIFWFIMNKYNINVNIISLFSVCIHLKVVSILRHVYYNKLIKALLVC